MKIFNILTVFILCGLLSPAKAVSGPSNGGGGKGVVCRNSDQSIKSVELLDLWEARVIYGRNILLSDRPLKTQIEEGISKLKIAPSFLRTTGLVAPTDSAAIGLFVGGTLEDVAEIFLGPSDNNMLRRLRGVALTQTDDSNEQAVPEGCKIEQLVQYRDMPAAGGIPRILVAQDLVDHMDITNQAALYLHEGFYTFLRTHSDEQNSVRVRRAIGFIMAGESFHTLDSILQSKTHFTCETDWLKPEGFTRIHFVDVSNMVVLIPEAIGGATMLGLEIPGSGIRADLAKLLEAANRGHLDSSLLTPSEFAIGAVNSPIDFDLDAKLDFYLTNKNKITLNAKSFPGRSQGFETQTLKCNPIRTGSGAPL